MIQKLKAFWSSLPHPVQAMVILFVTTAGTTLAHAVEDGIVPHNFADVKHLLGTAVIAGIVAVRAFYMLPNGNAQLVAQAKAQNQQGQLPPQNFQR